MPKRIPPQALSVLAAAVFAALASGCAATKSWWYDETGRMTAEDAAARGYPDCVGLTLEKCGRKHRADKDAAAEPAP